MLLSTGKDVCFCLKRLMKHIPIQSKIMRTMKTTAPAMAPPMITPDNPFSLSSF